MGAAGLEWQKIEIPFVSGLRQKEDKRSLDPPGLTICKDVQFDENGDVQTRPPFATPGSNNILGGGALANVRRVVGNGDELLCFTADTLYSWSPRQSAWAPRGTHLAVKVTERARYVNPDDQIDGDRAELGNTVVFAWAVGADVFVAAHDKTTGAVIAAPTKIAGDSLPRLVATTTRILLFTVNTGALGVRALDPADVPTGVGSATTIVFNAVSFGGKYDVTRQIGADAAVGACQRAVTTSYSAFAVTAGLAITSATPARVCKGGLAVSCTPDGTKVQVARGNTDAGTISGDLITIAGFVDVFTAQAIGTFAAFNTLNHVAAAHRSVQDAGQNRCYVFWTVNQLPDATDWSCKSNWVDTGNNLGAQGTFAREMGVASRAFDYGGRVFAWFAFAGFSSFAGVDSLSGGQLQNTYFLLRDDAFLCAKAAAGTGGGYAPTNGRLPGVQLTAGSSTFSWCATERRIVPSGVGGVGTPSYSDRGPREVTFAFDSNEARRCARLGQTLYVSGGEIVQYDGVGLYEVGYHVMPWYFGAIELGGAGGQLAAGVYAYKQSWRWSNAAGDLDRSTTSAVGKVTVVVNPDAVQIPTWKPTYVSHKGGAIVAEVWRTQANPSFDSPFFLVSSLDPTVVANPNRYLLNDPTVASGAIFNDVEADATIGSNPTHPENGAVLVNLAPPAASILIATPERIFLAGISDAPNTIRYSKRRANGEVAAFHPALSVDVPPQGGDLTALAFLNETLVAARRRAIYMLPGDGFGNVAGDGSQNYGPARLVSSDLGVESAEAIATAPFGLFFKSDKGWYVLDRGWGLKYVGGAISGYDSDPALSVHVVESKHQIRVLTANRMLVYDYVSLGPDGLGQWSEWTISDGLGATLWAGGYVYAATGGPKQEIASMAATGYGLDVELAWAKPAGPQGQCRIRWLEALGEYRGAHRWHVRVAHDYQSDVNGNPLYVDDQYWTPSPSNVGGQLQLRKSMRRGRCEAIKIRITAVGPAPGATGSLALAHGLTLGAAAAGGQSIYVRAIADSNAANGVRVEEFGSIVTIRYWAANSTSGQIAAALAAQTLVVVTANATPAQAWAAGDAFDATPLVGGTDAAPVGDACKLTGVALEVGLARGAYRQLPAAQKT